MQVIVRWIAAVYSTVELPPDATEDTVKAEAFACQVARERKRKVCLVVSRRLKVWVNERGEVTSRSGPETPPPHMSMGGCRFVLTLRQDG